ncbi:nucleotidyl transferase AbiEii/AbiGii toxin family protein [Mesorhizobium sp. LjRoot246]|uniref:nucleotidyl transferase AbiEii/AbiGii toxin family protein n=1 Tax=Mesorhizobium sp. LjRoot246 TaxID=3342294 RepID=UPI003F508EF8
MDVVLEGVEALSARPQARWRASRRSWSAPASSSEAELLRSGHVRQSDGALRGCVFAPETRHVSAAVEDRFGFAEIQVVSFADLYSGKIMAALDRQHPRDLFDIRDLLANEGIADE